MRGLAEGLWFLSLRETGITQNMPATSSEVLEVLVTLIYKILINFMQLLSEIHRSVIMKSELSIHTLLQNGLTDLKLDAS